MRSIILIAVWLSVTTTGFSQFTKGDKLLVGDFSIQTEKRSNTSTMGSEYETRIYSINPTIGFFVNENVAVGFGLGYSNSFSKDVMPGYYKSEGNNNSFYAGFMVRRYVLLSEKFFFLIEGKLNYVRGENSTSYISYNNGFNIKGESKTDDFSAVVAPRFVFFPTPKWGIEAGIGSLSYSSTSTSNSNASTSRFNLNYGVFSLGFAYYIRQQN